MDYTENYHLPQWAEDDRILMEDFNEAMENIEGGITAAAAVAEEAAKCPYVTGTYTGNGKTMAEGGQLISTGFRPKFVIISRGWVSNSRTGDYFLAVGDARIAELNSVFSTENTGFVVASSSSGYVTMNTSNVAYSFVAFQ